MDNLTRRGFLTSMLALGVAPAIVKASSLMPGKAERHVWHAGQYIPMWALGEQSIWIPDMDWILPGVDAIRLYSGPSKLHFPVYIDNWGSPNFGQLTYGPTYTRDSSGRHIYARISPSA